MVRAVPNTYAHIIFGINEQPRINIMVSKFIDQTAWIVSMCNTHALYNSSHITIIIESDLDHVTQSDHALYTVAIHSVIMQKLNW